MQGSHQTTPKIVGALAVAATIGVGGFLLVSGVTASTPKVLTTTSVSTTSQSTPVVSTTPATTPAPSTATTPSVLSYKDGTYNTTTHYEVPDGQNSLAVTLTIAGDKITNVKTSSTVEGEQSQFYIDSFNADISSAVVGTPLTSASVSRVGGASLTSDAFNDTLRTISSDAKA